MSSSLAKQQVASKLNPLGTRPIKSCNKRYPQKPSFNSLKRGFLPHYSAAEWSRGPRARRALSGPLAEKKEVGLFSSLREQYNLPDFQTDLEKAKFYVIKACMEDDIHKSVKYGAWASSSDGNKKLDDAFRGKDPNCPIFLLFTVTGSEQFVGVAEMVGHVDFDKEMKFPQRKGCLPVRWHIVKDVPNSELIILENFGNMSVIYTKDTDEIGLKQGVEMLSIFKKYTEKTSLLDDFGYYEYREKSFDPTGRPMYKAEAYYKSNLGYEQELEGVTPQS